MADTESLSDGLSELNISAVEENEISIPHLEVEVKEVTNEENVQSYFTWVEPSKLEASGATAQQMIEIIQDRFLDTDSEVALKFNSTELITDKGTLAFANVFMNNFYEAKAALAEARTFIQNCSKQGYQDELHFTGFDYVFDCLEIFMDGKEKCHVADITEFDVKSLQGFPKYHSLCNKSKAAVRAMKFYFHRHLRKDINEQVQTCDEVIDLDPECAEWHFCKSQCLKYQRRGLHIHNNQPFLPLVFDAEIKEIDKANELCPNHPQYMLSYCSILAESARRIKPTFLDWRTPLSCGKREFRNVREITDYLSEECRKILKVFDQCVRVNVTIADIFMKWLPRACRDFDFAESCIKRALDLHPKSSKANHQMAMYYMLRTPALPGYIEKAEEHCAIAAECDPRNFPASAELIQILLGKPQENQQRIMDILNRHMNESLIPMTPRNTSDLHLYKGLLLHLLPGHELEAVENWMKAQDLQASPLRFDFLLYNHERYKWPNDHLAVANLRKTVKFAMADGEFFNSKPFKAFDDLISNFDEVEKKRIANEDRFKASNGLYRGIRSGGPHPRESLTRGTNPRRAHSRVEQRSRGRGTPNIPRPPQSDVQWRLYGDHGVEGDNWRR